jgi:PLAT/LH2 domain
MYASQITTQHTKQILIFCVVVKYKLFVKTGGIRGARTDANVFVQLFGENGDTGEYKIEASGKIFERGHTDIVEIETGSLGELTKLRIGHGMLYIMVVYCSSARGGVQLCKSCLLNNDFNFFSLYRWKWIWKWLVP